MIYGTTHYDWTDRHWRPDQICLQEKCNIWHNRAWWTCVEHDYSTAEHGGNQDLIYQELPVSNCMERGVSKRGVTRREHALCLLETRYPCQEWTHAAESKKSVKRKYKDGRSVSPRSVCGDQPLADEGRAAEPVESRAKRQCTHHRSASYDALRDKVLQGVGSDLIAPWLNPMDMLQVKRAFLCKWKWSATWHGGRVVDRDIAARLVVHVHNRMSIADMKRLYGTDKVFSALRFILSHKDFVQAAYQYCHYKSIRKLQRLKS